MITVFGSINVDLVFDVPRLPTRGETVLGPRYDIFHGGKGANQAVAAARAGARTVMVGAVGSDPFAAEALKSLVSENVDVEQVRTFDIPTGCAAIGVDGEGENQIMVARGANARVRSEFLNARSITESTVLLVQNETPLNENWSAIRRVKEAGGTVILNAAPAEPVPADILAVLDFLIVNEVESRVVARAAGIDDMDPVTCCRELARRHPISVIVTLGAEGAVLCSKQDISPIPSPRIESVDSTGAGDTFCGVFAASLDQGIGIETAVKRACVAGALSCLRPGARTGMPSSESIDAELARVQR